MRFYSLARELSFEINLWGESCAYELWSSAWPRLEVLVIGAKRNEFQL